MRHGAQEMTRYGMLPQDFAALAKLKAMILRDAVTALCSEFKQMHDWLLDVIIWIPLAIGRGSQFD